MKNIYTTKKIIGEIFVLTFVVVAIGRNVIALGDENYGLFTYIPTASTTAVLKISTSTVMFTGRVNPNGLPTTYWFEYDEVGGFLHHKTGFRYAGKSYGSVPVDLPVDDLYTNSKYSYFIVAKNDKGTEKGRELYFKTNNN